MNEFLFLFFIITLIIGSVSFRIFIWPKLLWKFGSTTTRYKLLLNTAKENSYLGFSTIADDETANGVVVAIGRYDPEDRRYNPTLYRGEYLFAGHRMHNYLIVRLCNTVPTIGTMGWIIERIAEVPKKYPRLRMVYIVDIKEPPQSYLRKIISEGGYIFFLKDYYTPESLIRNLTEITVDPKDHPEILVDNKGAGI